MSAADAPALDGFKRPPSRQRAPAALASARGIARMSAGDALRVRAAHAVLDAAAVVKELVENALDAGATRVDVRVRGKGALDSIVVADNGGGVAEVDWGQLCTAGSTSKIGSWGELEGVMTFGFRGEALSAVCGVCKGVGVVTRVAGRDAATSLKYASTGALVEKKPAARPVGTTVQVEGLFHALPVRRQDALKNAAREMSRVVAVVQAYALIAIGVRVELKVASDVKVLTQPRIVAASLPGAAPCAAPGASAPPLDLVALRSSASSVLGRKAAAALIELAADELLPLSSSIRCRRLAEAEMDRESASDKPHYGVRGLVSSALANADGSGGRASSTHQFLFANGRPVDLPRANRAANEVYRRATGRSSATPALILNFSLPAGTYDVNMSPDKRQLSLHDEPELITALVTRLETMWAPKEARAIPLQTLSLPLSWKKPREHGIDACGLIEDVPDSASQPLPTATDALPGTQRQSLSLPVLREKARGSRTEGSTALAQIAEADGNLSGLGNDEEVLRISTRASQLQGVKEGLMEPVSKEHIAETIPEARFDTAPSLSVQEPRAGIVAGEVRAEPVLESESDLIPEPGPEPEVESDADPGDKLVVNSLVAAGYERQLASEAQQEPEPPEFEKELAIREKSQRESSQRHQRQLFPEQCQRSVEVDTAAGEPIDVPAEPSSLFTTSTAAADDDPTAPMDLEDEQPTFNTQLASQGPKEATQASQARRNRIEAMTRALSKKRDVTDFVAQRSRRGGSPTKRPRSAAKAPPSASIRPASAPARTKSRRGRVELDDDIVLVTDTAGDDKMAEEQEPTRIVRVDWEHILASDLPRRVGDEDEGPDSTGHGPTGGQARAFERASVTAATDMIGETPAQQRAAEMEMNRLFRQEWFKDMEILGQFNRGFIICKLEDDLFIVDQHASDEKFNFEDLQRSTVIKTQRLVKPLSLELSTEDELIVLQHLPAFRAGGFDISHRPSRPPTQRLFLNTQPFSKRTMFVLDDLHDIINTLKNTLPYLSAPRIVRPPRVRAMFASRACRKSVMIGTALDRGNMERLVRNLASLEHPWTCPHGRPTMRHLCALPSSSRVESVSQ